MFMLLRLYVKFFMFSFFVFSAGVLLQLSNSRYKTSAATQCASFEGTSFNPTAELPLDNSARRVRVNLLH